MSAIPKTNPIQKSLNEIFDKWNVVTRCAGAIGLVSIRALDVWYPQAQGRINLSNPWMEKEERGKIKEADMAFEA